MSQSTELQSTGLARYSAPFLARFDTKLPQWTSGASLCTSGCPARLLRSSGNGRVEALKRRNVSRDAPREGIGLQIGHPRWVREDVPVHQAGGIPTEAAALVDMQRDEGSELRREAVPDEVPTAGSGVKLQVLGVHRQPARDELEPREGGGVLQDERLDADGRLEDELA